MVPPEISQFVIVPFYKETEVFDKVAVLIVVDVIVPAFIVELAIVASWIVEPSTTRSVMDLIGALPRNGILLSVYRWPRSISISFINSRL